MVAGLLESELGSRQRRCTAENSELGICSAAVHQRVRRPWRTTDQIQRLDLYRGRQGEGRNLRCGLPAMGRRLFVPKDAADLLAYVCRRRLRSNGAVLQDVHVEPSAGGT